MPDLNSALPPLLWLICSAIAIIGSAYAAIAAVLIHRQARLAPLPAHPAPPSVTILKPLYGAEPQLAANLLSFDAQDYAGPVEIICGVRDPSDPAAEAVKNLSGKTRHVFQLAKDAPDAGPNRKISNILNMMRLSRNGMIALSDSDMRVTPDYLAQITAPFADPNVGLVTCLYRGLPVSGFWSRLHAASIDHHFLPNVLIGLALGMAEPCFGSTIALRRETLQKIGGFEAFADKLADDYEIGRAVRQTGAKAVIPPIVLEHTCGEETFSEVVSHELRWAKTIRLVDPIGYAGSIVTHPLPFAVSGVLLDNFTPFSLGVLAFTLACRSLVPIEMKRGYNAKGASVALGPLRDLLSFAIFVASFLPFNVTWRGHSYRVRQDGTMTSDTSN